MPSFDDSSIDLSFDASSSSSTPSLPAAPPIDLLGGLGDMEPGGVSYSEALAAEHVNLIAGEKEIKRLKRNFLTPAGDGTSDWLFYIDNSTLEQFNTCNRKGFYYAVKGREIAAQKSYLIFGGAIHSALEQRYKRGLVSCTNDTPVFLPVDPDASPTAIDRSVPLATLQDAYIERYMRGIILHEDEHRTPSRAKSVIRAYNDHYPVEPFQLLNGPDGSPLCEIGFAVPIGKMVVNRNVPDWTKPPGSNDSVRIGTIHIIWTGRIDLPVTWDNEPTIGDHKTTIMLGATFADQFRLAPQMMGYMWAANNIPEIQRLLGGRRFNSAFVNAICVRKITRTGVPTEFVRNRYFYDQSLQDEWKQDTITLITEFLNNFLDGYFPKKANWCIGKYGACQYLDVCAMPVSQRGMMLHSTKFEDVTWNPLDDR